MALSDEIQAFAAYLSAPREHFDAEEQALLDEDLAKARAAMEVAWLERLAAGKTNQRAMPEERQGVNSERLTFGPAETIGRTTSDDEGAW